MPNYPDKPLYNIWSSMRQRCENPNALKYPSYGARGITVCERWSVYKNFEQDMGERPSPDHSVDRIDNDGPYSPENCRWATRSEQQLNRRQKVMVTVEGKEYRAYHLARIAGVKTDTIQQRAAKGLPYEQVISPDRVVTIHSWPAAVAASKAKAKLRTRCKKGHELTPENTYHPKPEWKLCRKCYNERKRNYARDHNKSGTSE